MSVSSDHLNTLVENELAKIGDPRVTRNIRSLRIPQRVEMRGWDYGAPGECYPCWLVLAHPPSNTAIAYCEFGFGPATPWGLLFLEGEKSQLSLGMDSGWFKCFLDACFDSMALTELPIWRVFRRLGSAFPGIPITEEGSWCAAWSEVMRLRAEQSEFQYGCYHSVHVGKDN